MSAAAMMMLNDKKPKGDPDPYGYLERMKESGAFDYSAVTYYDSFDVFLVCAGILIVGTSLCWLCSKAVNRWKNQTATSPSPADPINASNDAQY